MSRKIRVLMSGGGTGGHIFPAVAIVEALKKKADVEALFVGANGRMEMEKIPALGYAIEGLPIAGFQRGMTVGNMIKNIQLPIKILFSLIKVFYIIYRFKPDFAIGTGGYASAPTLKMAQWMGIPTYIQEQNAQPGKTNLFLASGVRCAFVSYEESLHYFKGCDVMYLGNAIRESFFEKSISREEALSFFGLNKTKKTVFVTGGSLGARAINEAIAAKFDELMKADIQLIWHTGKAHYDQYKHFENENCRVYDFIYEMQKAYAASDLIVTRAGGVLFEIFVVGLPAIVLPSPYVADDHQTPNAEALVHRNAAIMIKDKDSVELVVPKILELARDERRLSEMSAVMKSLAKPHAASQIADKILQTYL